MSVGAGEGLGVWVGVPLGVAVAIFTTEFAPPSVSTALRPAIQLLAGIPSVIYGFIGLVILVPLIREVLGGPGLSVLSGSIILGIMILPNVISISEDAIRAVPKAYRDGALAGGLYGVSLGSAFFGESMFALTADASKAAFVALAERLAAWRFHFIDCQVYTEHLDRFGAYHCRRARFLARLERALEEKTRRGPWTLPEEAPGGEGR